MKKILFKSGFTIIFIVLTVLFLSNFAASLPSPAAEFYGNILINDSPAAVGTNISAYDQNGTLCGYFTVSNQGYYGTLSCNGDDSATAVDEGAITGEQVEFFVNSSRAVKFGDSTWQSGVFKYLNLSIKNYPPHFLSNWTNYTINESDTWIFNATCSDLNIDDNLTYYDNTTRFDINSTTGIITWTPRNADVGNHSILITCSDGVNNITQYLNVTVLDVNNPPILTPIGPLIAMDGQLFSYTLTATDSDGDNLTFFSNSTLFTVNNQTGYFSFTPTIPQIGNYTIIFWVTDNQTNDSEIVRLTIVRGPYCGDDSCGAGEDCASCAQDCGTCPEVPAKSGAGAIGGGGGAALGRQEQAQLCVEKWECSTWSICSLDEIQTRKCIDVNSCETEKNKPQETERCIYIPTCNDNIKNGREEGIDCGGVCPPCKVIETCFDGILNQDEEEIDCGGVCSPCEIEQPTVTPPQLAPMIKKFPWLLLLLVCLLLISITAIDRAYIRKLSKKDFEEYRKQINIYNRIRRYIYLLSLIFSYTAVVFIIYIYLTSDIENGIEKYLWLPISIVIVSLIVFHFVIRHLKYREYTKIKKERMLAIEEKKRRKKLIEIEDNMLISLEKKIILHIAKEYKARVYKNIEFAEIIRKSYTILRHLYDDRKEKAKPIKITNEIAAIISDAINNPDLIELARDYPEFEELLHSFKKLNEKDTPDEEVIELFLTNIIIISKDQHLQTVLKASKESTEIFNKTVDVYEFFKNQMDEKELKEDNLIENEGEFSKVVGDGAKGTLMQKISENPDYVSTYNSLVDLFNHYSKRKELHKLLKTVKKQN